ncbi:hypothetical protein [Exiguobacterium undae]
MTIDEVFAEYNFEYINNEVTIQTDFEKIKIYIGDNIDRYNTRGERLIRFLNEELLDIYPITAEGQIHPVFFLPSHITDEFFDSLINNKLIVELQDYYLPIAQETYTRTYIGYDEVMIPNKKKASYGTSLYGTDNVSMENQISAAEQLLELNSMVDHKIAIGSVEGHICLLEKSKKDRDTRPKSRHYNLWKFNERLTNGKFEDIASNFSMI